MTTPDLKEITPEQLDALYLAAEMCKPPTHTTDPVRRDAHVSYHDSLLGQRVNGRVARQLLALIANLRAQLESVTAERDEAWREHAKVSARLDDVCGERDDATIAVAAAEQRVAELQRERDQLNDSECSFIAAAIRSFVRHFPTVTRLPHMTSGPPRDPEMLARFFEENDVSGVALATTADGEQR